MSKKMKVFVSVVVAVLVLTVGGMATVVMAQEGEDTPFEEETTTGVAGLMPQVALDGLLARVAEIMGISEEELMSALKQARQEMMEEKWLEAFNQWLDKAVAEGILSEEEAEELRQWWEQRPEFLEPGLFRRAFSFWDQQDGPKPSLRLGQRPELRPQPQLNPRMWQQIGPDDPGQLLEEALERGIITEDKGAKIRQWLEKRPDTSNGLSPRARIFKPQRGRQMMAVPGEWGAPPAD